MLDGEIRASVAERLLLLHGGPPAALIRHELAICLGATRVDVAAVNGHLMGCEIKGDSDNLSRLPRQVALYGLVLDRAIVVGEGRRAERLAASVPDWWGIWRASKTANGALIDELRPARDNPLVDPLAVCQLLWRDEVLDELAARDAVTGLRRATRWRLWERLAGLLDRDSLGEVVRNRLRARQGW